MSTIDATSLADMTISALERTAMVLAEPAAESDEQPELQRFARIAYWGPSKGTLTLGATDGFLCELAASLLGVEADEVDVETHGHDVLKEMANTVAGSVIVALSGEICEYSLGLPELVAGAAMPAAPSAACTLVADGGALQVAWSDERAAQAA